MEFLPSNLRRHLAGNPVEVAKLMSPVLSGLYFYALISQFVELKDMFSVG